MHPIFPHASTPATTGTEASRGRSRGRPRRAGVFLALLASVLLAACGGDEGPAPAGDAGVSAEAGASQGPSVTVRLGDETLEFTGGRCFVTESGGSQGGISVSKARTAEGVELGIDWAGDSPNSSMVRIEWPDGTQLEASGFGASPDAFEVSVSGSSATVRTTMRPLFEPGALPKAAVLEVSCR